MSHIDHASKVTNICFGALILLVCIYRAIHYAIDQEFFDAGLSFFRSLASISYFVIWAALYCSRYRNYAHYASV